MRLLLVSAALWAAMGSLSFAQSVADIGGPRELPPPSYQGQQYVDSRGCVFLRAGLAGRTNWVPRVSRDRRVLCGYPPTFGPKPVIEMADEAPATVEPARPAPAARVAAAAVPVAKPAPKSAAPRPVAQAEPSPADAPTVVSAGKPAEAAPPRAAATRKTAVAMAAPSPADEPTVLPGPRAATGKAPQKAPQAAGARVVVRAAAAPSPADEPTVVSRVAPPAAARPAPERNPAGYQVVAGDGTGRRIGCFSNAPVPQRVRTADGGSVVVCTAGDGTLDGWRSPIYAEGGVGAALARPEVAARADHAATRPAADSAAMADAVPTPPKGYRLAWTDDRLNPNRGKGTAEGQAAQDRIWTRDVPAQLQIEEALRKGKKVVIVRRTPAGDVSVSAKGAAAPQAKAAPGALLQVGTFGVPANAEGAAARLAALGLPVKRSRITKDGKTLTIVMAGPFADGSQARAALSAARRAGFADAFLR